MEQTQQAGIESHRLVGKRAFVSAAAQGIGRAIALRLASEGASVLACDVNGDKLAELAGPSIETITADATSPAEYERILAGRAPFHVLANCVGWVHHSTILDISVEDWQRSFKINVDSTFHAIRAFLPSMLANGGGSIINIASAASSVKGFPNRAAYGATKAALIGLTRSVAVDYIRQGIRCNAICPGTIESPSLQDRINAFDDPVAARQAFIARQPMGRLGTPEEIAALAAYMASDESAYMTGSIVLIDGGTLA